VRVLEASGLRTVTGGMSTVIEAPDLDSLLRAVAAAHAAVKAMGVKRIHIDLRIDHRLDKEATVGSKLRAIGKK
jgi:uncharacterized protein (TIGR00106 family)